MAKGYLIAQVDVENIEVYQEYSEKLPETLAPYGGRFLVRGGRREVVEGASRQRLVVIEFPSYDKATEFFHSPAYRTIVPFRMAASTADIVLVEGITGVADSARRS